MVYKLKPLELSFDFEDRVYDLGDTVDLQVTLTPNSDVDVRGGRVDLVCDQRYVQRATTFVPYVQSQWRVRGQTRDVTTEREERVVHSTVSLLERARHNRRHPNHTPDQAFDSADTASTFRGGYSTPTRRSELLGLQVDPGRDYRHRARPQPESAAGRQGRAPAGAGREPCGRQAPDVPAEKEYGACTLRALLARHAEALESP